MLVFQAGAALATLHPLVARPREDVPAALLRDRLALRAAEACLRLAGRAERAAELRDELHLLRPGDRPGPAGAVFELWRRAVGTRLDARWSPEPGRIPPEAAAELVARAEREAATPVTAAASSRGQASSAAISSSMAARARSFAAGSPCASDTS